MDIIKVLVIALCLLGASAISADSFNPNKIKTLLDSSITDPLDEPSIRVDLSGIKQEVMEFLKNKKFNELNTLLHRYQLETESNILSEERLFTAYYTFRIKDSGYEELFDEWIKATPDSYQAYVARASYYYAMGWKKRGTKWASETNNEQFKGMRQYFNKAESDILKGLSKNKHALVPYCMLIGIKNRDEDEKLVIQGALKINPATFEVRACYLNSLAPRWGGSFKKMQAFVSESMKHIELNSKLKLLVGKVYEEAGKIQALKRKYTVADKLFTQALSFGENHSILKRRGESSFRQENYKQALSDFNYAIELNPESGSYYYWRSKTYSRLGNFEKASADIQLAVKYKPWDEYVQKHVNWLVRKLEYNGYVSDENRNFHVAIAQFTSALNLDPNRASTYYHRARSYIRIRDHKRAMVDAKKSVELAPNEFAYYKQLDWLLARNRDWDQIIKYWDTFISLNPKEDRAYVERGGAYFRKGDIISAVSNAKIAADMGNVEGKEAYEKFKHMLK